MKNQILEKANVKVLSTDVNVYEDTEPTFMNDNNYGEIACYPIDVLMTVSYDDTTYNITFQNADIVTQPQCAGFVSINSEASDDSASFSEILEEIDKDGKINDELENIAQKLYDEAIISYFPDAKKQWKKEQLERAREEVKRAREEARKEYEEMTA